MRGGSQCQGMDGKGGNGAGRGGNGAGKGAYQYFFFPLRDLIKMQT